MVRTLSIQRQERHVTKEMLDKFVGVPRDPAGVAAQADRGQMVSMSFQLDKCETIEC